MKLENKTLLKPVDIAEILRISVYTAYGIIKELNNEMKKLKRDNGKSYYIFETKVYRKYFEERYCGLKFLDKKEIMKKYEIKQWEAEEMMRNLKKDLISKGYKTIRGRIPENFLKEHTYA